jgi:YHS domain-containing protein
MEGLLSLLLFAGFFYFLMRLGCGAHNIHGHFSGQNNSHKAEHSDPVCGMHVDPDKGYGMMHDGKLYRFCSRKCLDKFDSDPKMYLKTKENT